MANHILSGYTTFFMFLVHMTISCLSDALKREVASSEQNKAELTSMMHKTLWSYLANAKMHNTILISKSHMTLLVSRNNQNPPGFNGINALAISQFQDFNIFADEILSKASMLMNPLNYVTVKLVFKPNKLISLFQKQLIDKPHISESLLT